MPVLEALNGVTLHPVEFRRPEDLVASFATIKSEHADALVTFSDPVTYVNAKQSLNWKPFPGCPMPARCSLNIAA